MKINRPITRFKPGSVHELAILAIPLIMVSLSENIMIFFDRIILSHYSIVSLNAATLGSQAIEIFQYSLWAIVSMCEIFVAALFAKNALNDLPKPCWQMIYLSVFTLPIIVLLSHFTGTLVLSPAYQQAGLAYYQISLYSVPLIGIITALSGFFIGQGKIKLVFFSTVCINIINLGLDFIFIFGVPHYLLPLGAKGAALSAIISLGIQMLWLLLVFLNKTHRTLYQTHKMHFNLEHFTKSIRVGFPVALSHACEMIAWLFIIKIIATTGLKNFTLVSIGSTLYLVYGFINDGISRSLATLISNHRSAKNFRSISKSINSGIALFLLFMLILAIPLFVAPNIIFHMFNLQNTPSSWHPDITLSFIFIWFYFLFSGIYWIYAATLIAAHHTKFIMITNMLSIWLLSAIPLYMLIHYQRLTALSIWPIMCLYAFISCLSLFTYYTVKIKRAFLGT